MNIHSALRPLSCRDMKADILDLSFRAKNDPLIVVELVA
jgi:hypothetical protein